MPIKRDSRLWDPARRIASTHRASPVRTFVYEQLGLSKPGFWADWRKRTIEEPEPEGYQADEEKAPEVSQGPTEVSQGPTKYEPVKFQGDGPSKKKQFENMKFEQPAPAPPEKGTKIGGDLAKLMDDQAKAWFKTYSRGYQGSNLIDGMRAEGARDNANIAFLLHARGQLYGASALKTIGEYFDKKIDADRRARANRAFGYGEPTNFDKMLDIFYRPKPPYKPPTYEILTQGTTTFVAKKLDTTIGQLNVSQNGYVSQNLIPQKQAAHALGKMQPPRNSLAANKPLQGNNPNIMKRAAIDMSAAARYKPKTSRSFLYDRH